MFDTIASRGGISLLGGFLIALVIGATYLWGIISLYITSYFRIVDKLHPNLTYQTTALVFPFMFFGQATAMPLGVKLMKKFNAKTCCIVSGFTIAIFIQLSSYTESFSTFALIFGIGGGSIIGFLYMIPVAHCYKYFPKKKGTVSGIIVAGSGFGTFLFSIVAVDSINPLNKKLESDYYGAEIAMNVPNFLRKLSIICFSAIIIGSFLLLDLLPGMDPYAQAHKHQEQKKPKLIVQLMQTQFQLQQDEDEQKNKNPFGHHIEMGFVNNYQGGDQIYGQNSANGFWAWENNNYHGYGAKQYGYMPPDKYKSNMKEHELKAIAPVSSGTHIDPHHPVGNLNQCPRVRDAPTVKIFWVIFLCMMFGANYGLLMSGTYKSFAKKYIHDDKFLSLVGAIGSMGNGLSRFFWAAMLDKFQFKCLYTALLTLNGLLAATVSWAVHIPQVYLIYVLLTYVCYGGHLGMFPAIASQVFGVRNGTQIYGLLFQGFAMSNALQFLFINVLKPKIGFTPIFYIEVVFSGISMFIANSFEFKYDWSQKIRENNERKRLAAH